MVAASGPDCRCVKKLATKQHASGDVEVAVRAKSKTSDWAAVVGVFPRHSDD